VQYEDERAFGAVANTLSSPDTWVSVSAAEGAGRLVSRRLALAPLVIDASGDKAPTALRITCLNALVTLAPLAAKTFDLAAALAGSDVGAARSAAIQALVRLGDDGIAKLKELAAQPAIASRAQPGGQTFQALAEAALARAAAGGGRGGRAGGGGRGPGAAGAPRTPRPDAEYRQLVERWIVPAYNGRPAPRAIWSTPKGDIELELYPGDAPFGVEQFLRLVESGDIVGTEFTRLVPDFVAQQQPIRNASTLLDEVNRRGLTRGNLSWASAGLDTGRPGYTLGHTPQPHNEGNFTALGRVIRGMDVVDRLELGDRITAARMIR
jgi:cyclophilin family peptidyl-prolyl cis-trans isomerase